MTLQLQLRPTDREQSALHSHHQEVHVCLQSNG
jgi:hypothetical protein